MSGYVCILNVNHERKGSKLDETKLKETFEKMNAEVCVLEPTTENIAAKIRELRTKDFTNMKYVAFVYCSHGHEDGVVRTQNHENRNLQQDILLPLCQIPSLNGKLKLLLMQTCRGTYDFMKLVEEGPPKEGEPQMFPKYYVKLFATSEGNRSYRIPNEGAIFVNALCERLLNEYKTKDIMSIVHNVQRDVEAYCQINNLIPTHLNSPFIQISSSEDNLGEVKFNFTTGFSRT